MRLVLAAEVVLLLIAPVLAGAAEPPVITWVSEGVKGRETFLICGDGFIPGKVEVLRWVPPQPSKEEWSNEKTQRASIERVLSGKAAPLMALPERCALERLTVRGGRKTICILVGGGKTLRRGIALREVEVVNRHPV